MSSILKAIRKVEDEKRTGDTAAPNLMIDHGQAAHDKKPTVFLPLVSGVVLGVLVVGASLLILKGDDERTLDKNVAKNVPASSVNAATEEKLQPESKTFGLKNKTVTAVMPQVKETKKAVKEETIQSRSVASVADAAIVKMEAEAEKIVVGPRHVVPKEPATVNETPKHATIPSGVNLVVSEIFHQDDEANSMAVVNDLPVMIGTHVDNVIVIAINKDSVEFETGGRNFSIPVASQ